MNNKNIGALVILLVVAGGAFYGGMTYGKSQTPVRGQGASGQFAGGPNGARGGGFTTGQIIANDSTSITIKMQDGSTKIVLVSPGTQVMKSTSGTLNDLANGTTVTVSGTANADGSVTAQTVQIRPAGAVPFGGRTGSN